MRRKIHSIFALITIALFGALAVGCLFYFSQQAANSNSASTRTSELLARLRTKDLQIGALESELQRTDICRSFSQNDWKENNQRYFRVPLPDSVFLDDSRWTWMTICQGIRLRDLYIISATHPVGEGVAVDQSIRDRTLALFPKLGPATLGSLDLPDYTTFSLYATHIVTLTLKGRELTVPTGTFVPLETLVWNSSLANCSIDPSVSVDTGAIRIMCGSGDNGCFQAEEIEIDLFTKATRHIGPCTKNCDLGEEEPSRLTCE